MQPNFERAQRIRELKAKGLNQSQIANELGVTQKAISNMSRTHGIRWDYGAAARDQTGDKNPMYINGLSKSSVERLTRAIIKEAGRCLFTCERCSDYNKFQEQQRHHKDRDRSNNTSANIEVLCAKCHTLEHANDHVRDPITGRFV